METLKPPPLHFKRASEGGGVTIYGDGRVQKTGSSERGFITVIAERRALLSYENYLLLTIISTIIGEAYVKRWLKIHYPHISSNNEKFFGRTLLISLNIIVVEIK